MTRPVLAQACAWIAAIAIVGGGSPVRAADDATVKGSVVDPLGARVVGASVKLIGPTQAAREATTDASGEFTFEGVLEGRYQVEAAAAGFQSRTTDPMFVQSGSRTTLQVALPIGPLEQSVVVTAAATDILPSQIGAPVTVLDSRTLDALEKPDVLEALRLVPGTQVVQTGARGGTTSVFIRGGNSAFTKMLIDGVPANDIGGATDFSDFSTAGVDRVEVLRETNSVMNGSDALAGVINVITRRGNTHTPQLEYSVDGGNLKTVRNDVSLGGAVNRVDYFGDFSHFNTDNDLPNNAYTNSTAAGRVGLALGHGTDLSGTIRWVDRRVGSPGGFDLYRVADDSFLTDKLLFGSAALQSQVTDKWQATVRFGSSDHRSRFDNPSQTGMPAAFGDTLGNVVTLTGANGYSVTGSAILDFSGDYPSISESANKRQGVYAQTTYHLLSNLDLSGGGHLERERGYDDPDADPTATRNNRGAFVEGRGTVADRISVTAGVGFEHNEAFGNATTPRLSLAVFLRKPQAGASLGDTRLTTNAGKGIKAPRVDQEQSSVFGLLGPGAAAAAGISPVGPERSRDFDLGIEQGFWGNRARARVAYFNNDFKNLIEFVDKSVLPQLGVSPAAAAATGFGAYVNSQSYRARGVETSLDMVFGRVRVAGSYTHLDATVTQSLGSGALEPAINPAFPDIPIGAFSPLVGQRPFRRPPNLGSLLVSYTQGRGQVSVAGYFAGKSDDSTFLSDEFFGNSMLLPNRDLDAAYQKIDLSGSYRLHRRAKVYASFENLLDKDYAPAFGFPALPLTVRAGITVSIGGDR